MLRIVTDPRFADHLNPPGHPERVERAEVMEAVASAWQAAGVAAIPARPASRLELLRVHDAAYVDRVEATSGRATLLDPDTFTSPLTASVAALAAGSVLAAAEVVLGAAGSARAFAFVRPPGHHAERARAMGFCLYNNVALAAAHLLDRGAGRVAIVDFDVHHGNGTQWAFYDHPGVLYVSTHQYPYYPGTGAAGEAGAGRGEGFTVNVPMAAGATDGDYLLVFDEIVLPVLHAFAPRVVLVSAGYDIHVRDPLGGMRVSTPGCAALVGRLASLDPAGRRLLLVTEGGYHLKAFAASLDRSMRALAAAESVAGPPAPPDLEDADLDRPAAATERGPAAIDLVRAVHGRHWGL
jgi:acetoin utilization deacetylase AcuC-like enzyme